MASIVDLLIGLVFGIGLIISKMHDPNVVLGFFNIVNFDATLAFVFCGALVVSYMFTKISQKINKPFCEQDFSLPTKKIIDKKLIIGSSIFGIGWGLCGLCPAPAIINVVFHYTSIILFLPMFLILRFLKA